MQASIAHDYECATNRERTERARIVAEQIGGGYNAEQVGLAFLLQFPYNVFTVVGCRNVEQLLDSIGSCDINLTPEQTDYLVKDRISAPFVPQTGH